MSPSVDGSRPTKVLSRTSTARSGTLQGALDYAYPMGHVGHLTPVEEDTLAAFKTLLASHNLYTPVPPSHDEATLLRFLRARRWDPAAAHAQFAATAAWRAATDLDTLYDTLDVGAYEASRRLYPQWTGRRDRRGIPTYVFEIGRLDARALAAYQRAAVFSRAAPPPPGTPPGLVRLFALYEHLTRFTQPLCSQLPDRAHAGRTPVTLSTNIVDVSGVSLTMYWNLKGHMQAASELATAHYPETLDRIFIIGAPSFFTTVWGWIKRWFDPVTVSKIFILSPAEVLPTLESFIDVRNIPKKYGGELDFTWNDRPKLDDTIRAAVEWQGGYTDFPEGPLYWVPIDGGRRLQCVARGSVDRKDRNEVVATIAVAVPPPEEQKVPGEEGTAKAEKAEKAAAAAAAVATNGTATEPVGDKVDDAPAAAQTADQQQQQQRQQPVGKDAARPDAKSPASETFVDALGAQVPSPLSPGSPAEVLVSGLKDLPRKGTNEEVNGEGQAISNGKPVTTA